MDGTNTDTILIHVKIKKRQLAYLNKINKDNISDAFRRVIDEHGNMNKPNGDNLFLFIAFGMMFICLGVIQANILIETTMMITGVFLVIYGVLSFIVAKNRFKKRMSDLDELEIETSSGNGESVRTANNRT